MYNTKGGFSHVFQGLTVNKNIPRPKIRGKFWHEGVAHISYCHEGVTHGGKQTEPDNGAETEVILAETEVIPAETVSSVGFYGLTRKKLF